MSERKKVTLPMLMKKMADGVPITFITCYNYAIWSATISTSTPP